MTAAVCNCNCNYTLFTKLPWPGDSEGTFRSSSQAATCPPVYHTRRRLHTVPLIAERQAWKAVNTNFYSLRFDPTGNRTRVYRFSSRRSIHSTTDRLDFLGDVSGVISQTKSQVTLARRKRLRKKKDKMLILAAKSRPVKAALKQQTIEQINYIFLSANQTFLIKCWLQKTYLAENCKKIRA